jgi:hypothetical protein
VLVEPSPIPMPGLGPSLLLEFLAEPSAGTQPDPPAAEGEIMVQPVGFGVPSGRPAEGASERPCRQLSTGKYGEFDSYLHRPRTAVETLLDPAWQGLAGKLEESRQEREMAVSGEGSGALAPGGESTLDPPPGDPAAWLCLISPPGVEMAAPAQLPSSASSARAAEADAAGLVERWARRLALGGDARRAAARLEIGTGRFAGTELVVVAQPGHVSVEVTLPAAGFEAGLADRLRERLEGRGYGVDVTVR